jgi:hypothetical protein
LFHSQWVDRKKEVEPMSNQNDSFLDILSEAYEKGEKEQGMTVQELVKDLSIQLKFMLKSSDK